MIFWQDDGSPDVHALRLPLAGPVGPRELTHAVQSSVSSTRVSCDQTITLSIDALIRGHVARQRGEAVATMTLRVWPTRFLAIHFNLWWKGAESTGAHGVLATEFKHRQPTSWEPDFINSDPFGGTISPAREQEIADQDIQDFAASGLHGLAHSWSPPVGHVHAELYPTPDVDLIARFWVRYQQSTYKPLLKWCWIFNTAWCFNAAVRAEYFELVAETIDDQSVLVHYGRPVVFIFHQDEPGRMLWSAESSALLRAVFVAAGKGDPYLVGMGYNVTECAALGLNGKAAYGPLDVGIVGTAEGRKYSSHAATARGVTRFVNAQVNAVPAPAVYGDQRPWRGYGVPFADPPLTTELIAELRDCEAWLLAHPVNAPGNFALIYSASELSEYGGMIPTVQNDVHGTGLGFTLDAIAHVTGRAVLPWVWNTCNPANATYCSNDGAGWDYRVAQLGAYDSNVFHSATAGAWHTFSALSMAGGVARLYGDRGPDCGVALVAVDGGSAVACDCYSPTIERRQLLFESAPLASGLHVVRTEVSAVPNPLSTGLNVALDECRIQALPG